MIKIRWIDGRTAHTNGKGGWTSENKNFERTLNIRASSEKVKDYSPCIERSMFELAKKEFKGLEVLEDKQNSNQEYPENAVF